MLSPFTLDAGPIAGRLRPGLRVAGCLAWLAFLPALLCGCGTTGWEHRETLAQLYPVDAEGRMTASGKVRQPSTYERVLRSLIGPFGYRPTGHLVAVEDPEGLGRETILRLSKQLREDPALIAFAVPRFAAIGLKAPSELTRAQAVTALARALRQQLPRQPPVAEPFTEDAQATEAMIRLLLGAEAVREDRVTGETRVREDLPAARAAAIVRNLGETHYVSLPPATNALLGLGYVARTSPGRDPDVERFTREGIFRVARAVCRLTVERILQSEASGPVRAAAARALAAAREPWGEAMLLRMLDRETDAGVLRKVYRCLDAYRTPRVAQRLLETLKDPPDSLREALARQALLNYTQQRMGVDPAAWEAKLYELGYLDDAGRPTGRAADRIDQRAPNR